MAHKPKEENKPSESQDQKKEEVQSSSFISEETTVAPPKRSKKKGVFKMVILILLIIIMGGGTAAGVYYWQENQKIGMQQELEKVKKEKEDAEKNKQYLVEKAEKEAAKTETLRKLQQDAWQKENSNLNSTPENTNTNIVETNRNRNESVSVPTTEIVIDEITTTTEDISSPTENDSGEKTIVGDGFEIPQNTPIGYIKKLYEKNGKHYMDIDYIQWFVGEDAEPEIRKDGKCADWGEGNGSCYPSGGFYIRNVNPKIRTFEIASDAEVHMTTYPLASDGEKFGGEINYSEFKKLFTSNPDYTYLRDEPYYIVIDHNKIIIIAEQFIP